ncbi:MAG: phytanoyl-CoA dioxygenase family protein [Cyanobacteria bacterium]|nr:phytanoyl-CoA dioxygenase family protein [Cyanobacteriota bacterium]
MTLDLQGLPLIDRPDVDTLLAEGRFGRWSKQAANLSRQGFCLLEIDDASFLSDCREVIADQQRRLKPELSDWEAGRTGAPRVQDGWREQAAVRSLALQPAVLDLLRHVYGREPFAFQTLNFAVGSEQPYHSDAVHFHSQPHGFMCGVWIPLDDVQPDSGPLIYFPGSHRLDYHSAGSLGLSPEQVAAEPHPQRFFESVWQREVDLHGLQVEQFLPRRGEVLIWHANLLHGGTPVLNKQARRWSQVVHYYFADCLYTTPLNSFPADQGGPYLRNPFDLATGRNRWSQSQWEMVQANLPMLPEPSQRQGPDRSAPAGISRLRALLPQKDPPKIKPSTPLQGVVDVITPSQVMGWVSHAELALTEVRLLLGSQVIATAPINVERPDVVERLGRSGRFGFQLEIPDSHPDPSAGEPLRLLAMTADRAFCFPLVLANDAGDGTGERLRAALALALRGMRGHFDGLSPEADELRGWCYSRSSGPATVWLHAEGLVSRALSCTLPRAGMAAQGHHEACGFVLPLHLWPEAAGRQVWASFDEAGELWLPPMTSVRLPEAESALPESPLAGDQSAWLALLHVRERIDRMEEQRPDLETPPSLN